MAVYAVAVSIVHAKLAHAKGTAWTDSFAQITLFTHPFCPEAYMQQQQPFAAFTTIPPFFLCCVYTEGVSMRARIIVYMCKIVYEHMCVYLEDDNQAT